MTKRGPYVLTGNKCPIKWHNHPPSACPGRARIMCAQCGKSLLSHKTWDFCLGKKDEPVHIIDEVGRRRRRR